MTTKKPVFRKKDKGLYINTTPTKINYKGHMKKKISTNVSFYKTRYLIIQKEIEKMLLPLVFKLTKDNKQNIIKVLDVGCGEGQIFNSLIALKKKHKFNYQLYGIDPDPSALSKIKHDVNLKKGSAVKLPYKKNYFDLVTSKQVIEHLTYNDMRKSLKEMKRVLKLQGILYCETPNPDSLLAKAMGNDWWMYIDEHLTLVSPKKLKQLLVEVGFVNIKATTRAEIDKQIDEVREILHRKNNIILNTLLKRIRHRIIRYYIKLLKQESVTVCTASK